jgi:hypothetical protein
VTGAGGSRSWARARRLLRGRQDCDFRPNPFNSSRQIAHDQLRLEAEDAIPRATERAIAAGICLRAPGVPSPIDLDDDACRGHEKIDDEAPDGDLAACLDSEAAIANGLPQKALGFCRSCPKQAGARGEQLGAA